MAIYEVLVGCSNDKTGKKFVPGDTCTDADFDEEIIKTWLRDGVLKKRVGSSRRAIRNPEPEELPVEEEKED